MRHHAAYGRRIETLDVVAIDDNRAMHAVYRTLFRSFRVARCRVFDAAEPALEDMRQVAPHLVLTDWNMTPVDGGQLVRAMRHRSMEPLGFVPVIVLSAYASRELLQKSLQAGAQLFMAKPISPSMVHRRLEWIVQDARPMVLNGDHYEIEGKSNLLKNLAARNNDPLTNILQEEALPPDPGPQTPEILQGSDSPDTPNLPEATELVDERNTADIFEL